MEQLDKQTNVKNRDAAIEYWNLGPEVVARPGNYWRLMGMVWGVPTPQAQRQLCANCGYFNNTPEALEMMEDVPQDKFDADGGGRGYCEKLDFICHNLRACQAWERKDFESEDEEY
tara:strand:+ start:81 stop:428 length:348 start_codon:yes stop_codon:yes gene_type:complete